jgi:prephenate dehydrogenase
MKKRKLAHKIVGVTQHKESLEKARKRGVIDEGSLSVEESVRATELVILATPIYSIIEIAKSIVKCLSSGCIVTDVGSTKELVVKELEKIFPKDVYFVGGHPLAGSEQRGVDNAHSELFKDSIWIVTKTKKTNLKALSRIKILIEAMGANVLVMSPNKHDEVVSIISHLPHILASSLVNSTSPRYLPLAASGFKDTTRIASSDSVVWRDIYLSNKEKIVEAIERFNFNLSVLKRLIKKGDGKKILQSFRRAKKKRDDYCH